MWHPELLETKAYVVVEALLGFPDDTGRFGSVTVWRWNCSSGPGFRFPAIPLQKRFFFFFSVFQYSLTGKDGSGSGFGSWKTVPADGSGFRFRFGS